VTLNDLEQRDDRRRALSLRQLSFLSSYRAVLVKLSPFIKGCLLLMHSFSVTSANIVINHMLRSGAKYLQVSVDQSRKLAYLASHYITLMWLLLGPPFAVFTYIFY